MSIMPAASDGCAGRADEQENPNEARRPPLRDRPGNRGRLGPAAVIAVFSTTKSQLLGRKSYTGARHRQWYRPAASPPDSRSEASQRSGAPRLPIIGLPGIRTNQGQTPMATMARNLNPRGRHDEGREIRHLRLIARHGVRVVRLLSLCDARAVLRGAVLPARQRHRCTLVGLRHLRGGLPGAPVRGADLRPHRRSGRTQIHLPRDHRRDGHCDVPRRVAADVLPDRLGGTRPAGDVAPVPGPRPRR